MSKCDINVQSLKQIQTKVATTLRSYLKNKESVATLKLNMMKLLDNIAEQYDLAGINDIVNMIYSTVQKYGVIDQSSDFFSPLNIANLLTRADLGILKIDTLETSSDKLTDTEQVRTRLEANREFLDNAFGLAKEVLTYLVNQTNQNIFDCCFINRGSLNQNIGIVRNTAELNENIRQFQEELLRRITDYLGYIIDTSANLKRREEYKNLRQTLQDAHLYEVVDGTVRYTGVLEQLEGVIKAYLSADNFKPDILRELYITVNDSTRSQEDREVAKRRLDAYNANVILTHFDSYLSLMLGKSIEIKDFNRKTGEDKYQISGKTAKLTTTWRTSENIDVESEADAITKLAINTTPMFLWQGNTPLNGRYLHFSDFEHIIAKVKDLAYREDVMTMVFDKTFVDENESLWESLSGDTQNLIMGKSLSQVINLIRRNPRQYLHSIFELLTNEEFYDMSPFLGKKNFTDDELNKMYSIARGIFSPKYENSLYSLTSDLDSDVDFYSFVTQTVDSIFKVNYVQYYRDEDGFTQVRTLIDQSINNIRRSVEQTINTSNSIKLIKDFQSYKESLELTPNQGDFKYIEFSVPNTSLRVKVVASSGTVTVVDTEASNKAISNFEGLWRQEEIKLFLDSVLRLNLATDVDFLNVLRNQFGSYGEMCKSLFSFASRVILNQYISKEFVEGKTNDEKEQVISQLLGDGAPKYNFALDELGLIHGTDIPTLKNIAIAKANIQGVTTASLVKDGEGNGQSLLSLSRLLGSLHSQFDLQERQPWSATNEAILLTIPGLYEGVYTAKEFHNQTGDNKDSTSMGVSEMAYSEIVHDFLGGLIVRDDNSVVGNGRVMFLPSVNSDKGTIGRIKINLNKLVTINGVTKPIRDLNASELETLIAHEFGTIYQKMYQAVYTDWSTLDGYIRNNLQSSDPNVLGSDLVSTMPSLAWDYVNAFASFNLWWSSNREALKQYGSSPAAFVKYFTQLYNRSSRLHPLEIIDLIHYKNNKGNLAINQAFLAQLAKFNPEFLLSIKPDFNLAAYPTSQQFWQTKKAEVLKGLLKSRFRVNTTATVQPELVYLKNHYPAWINASGDMILAKATINGHTINVTSNRDLARLSESLGIANVNDVINELSSKYSLVLNPVLEQYNYLDYLFTQEFMISTVGSFIAHPEKSKSSDVLQQEAAHFQAQHKRNVSFTAAMHAFQLNLLNGIPEQYNLAVIDDITDEQGTILGLNNEIKPFDGATFVNPFIVYLENNSLGGARAGITKKQFVHFKSERTGSGGIIKTAGFGLTNDWIRNSPFLERMMRKMTDHVWLNQDGTPAIVDITTNYKGERIKYKDFYFKQGDRYFRINGIVQTGPNTYSRYLLEVKKDGTPVDGIEIVEDNIVVDTNYKLWNLFGGKNSMTMKGRFLELSNTSVENVVTAMNNIGTVIGHPSRIETQDQLWQPLKHVDVHYLATAGAVKQGAANINSAGKYHDDEDYDIQRINMYQAGIQLDKEHHADDSELSLMTQVISACAAKGYTFEAAAGLYDALRKSTEIGTKEHLEPMLNLFRGVGSQDDVLEAVMKTIVNSLSTSNGENFAKIIAFDLIRQAREGKKINFADEAMLPLSDNTVYNKIFSIIASFLTNAGIKQKIPGILSVLTPSHNIFRIYADRKYESFTNPELELAELLTQYDANPVFDVNNPNTNISNLELGRTYKITSLAPTWDGNLSGDVFYTEFLDQNLVEDERYIRTSRDGQYKNDAIKIYLRGQKEKGYFELIKDNEDGYYSVHFKTGNGDTGETFGSTKEERAILYDLIRRLLPDGAKLSTWGNVSPGGLFALNRLAEGYQQVGTRMIHDRLGNELEIPIYQKPLSFEPVESTVLVRTPSEYKRLKESIASGDVIKVVEDVTAGRDLAAYNVRFSTTDGQAFQLWDLDSATALFEYNDIKENAKDEVSKAMALTELFLRVFPGQPIDIDHMEMFLRRMLQRDLMNLSKSTPALNRQYKQLLDSNDGTQAWFNKFAQWVNIHLGTGLGSELELGSNSTLVPKNDLVYIRPGETTQEVANRIGGIDTLRHPDANGMHFGNPFSHSNYRGVLKVFPTVKEAVIAYELWLRGEAYLDIEPERRQWILELINSGALDNKPLVYYRETVPDTSYGALLGGMPYTYEKSPNHAHILLKLIIEHNSSLARPSISSRTTVNANNFTQIEPIVRQLLANTTKVRIGGQLVDVDKSSVVSQAYELIMSKTFATNFGLTEFDDINTIKNDRDFFIKLYLTNQATKVEENQYTMELKTSDGNHYYLLTKRLAVQAGLTKVDNIFTIVVDGITYRVDSNGNTMYELTPDTEIYTDGLGHDVIVTDDLVHYANTLHYDSINLSSRLIDYHSVVDGILKGLKTSSNKKVKQFVRYVTSNGTDPTQVMALNADYHSLTSDNYQQADPTNPILRAGWSKHTSFLKSLDIVAARIPAQSMQSFMPMKVVAYDNPDINTAHVSTMQILLQGSDFDIDVVSLATFDIDRNGMLLLWSPYANVESEELLNASLLIPIPSGEMITHAVASSAEEYDYSLRALGYFTGRLFHISKALVYNKGTKNWDTDKEHVNIDMTLDSPQKIAEFINLLRIAPHLTIPDSNLILKFAADLMAQGSLGFRPDNPMLIVDIFTKIAQIVNNHNIYFDRLSQYNLSKVVNNYTMHSMYTTIVDPVNLIQAQTSVDGTTGPLKREANKSAEAKEASTRTPGNFVNKYESITENQVGKEAIGICAVGLKSFFGLTQYSNYILNQGDPVMQARLILGKDHRGIVIGGNLYKTVANIRAKDPGTITNLDVLEALSKVTNDNDAALVLSALLSLATDNAKELTLSKLNAGTKMIGMYIYGITIGMDFRDVAKILMSDVGSTIKGLLDDDVFSERDGYNRVEEYLFKYFDEGPSKILSRFDRKFDSNGTEMQSPLEVLKHGFNSLTHLTANGKEMEFKDALVQWSRSNYHLSEKLDVFERLRGYYSSTNSEARELYNQLIDFVEDYVQQNHIIGLDEGTYSDIKKLAEGASEMRILGRILSLNQGIKTSPDELLGQVNLIERAIYNETENLEDLIDLTRFAFDEAYREEQIAKYEEVKHAFNILDVAVRTPHFMGYVQTLAIAAKEALSAFKFRSSKTLSLALTKQIKTKDESRIIKGIQNFVGDYLRKSWMRSREIQFIIPKGNKAFDKNGNMYELIQDAVISLGTDWGDATFRMWFENEVIPNLKKGIIRPGSYSTELVGNKFISDLGNDLLTTTVSRNPSVIYTLPINMLPRIDSERAIFNRYKSEFNRLAELGYQYEVTQLDPTTGLFVTNITKAIPLVDLFTYYAMIADGWKLGEKSLVPILEDFLNTGEIKSFHDFETQIDKSGSALSLENIDYFDLLPYVAPFESPYSSYSEYIQFRNPTTRKILLMRRLSQLEKRDLGEDNDAGEYTSTRNIKDYSFINGLVDTNYFPAGRVENPERTVRFGIDNNGKPSRVSVKYDIDSGKISYLEVDGNPLEIPELTELPTVKVNGVKKVNASLLESIIKHKLNPC